MSESPPVGEIEERGKDRPIIFSGPMVRALLAGRKTMTRRLLAPKHQRPELEGIWRRFPNQRGLGYDVGDRLWVRESLQRYNREPEPTAQYAADLTAVSHGGVVRGTVQGAALWQWKLKSIPSIHMPRWASRLTLAVATAKIERLQDITAKDAIAEGIDPTPHLCGCERCTMTSELCPATQSSIIMAFADLWRSLHGAGAWDANPWVIAPAFAVEQRNIDAPSNPSEARLMAGTGLNL